MKLYWNSHASRGALALAALAAMATPSHAQQSQQPATSPAEQVTGLDDVIVTATRRETILQKTPQAISVLNGEEQFEKGQTRLQDIATAVPNVNLTATNNITQLYVRGVGNSFNTVGGDPGVALYQDGAYISDQSTTNASFFDIQRVEVLRGPQGTLYGRNATGGAISIVSAKPSSEFMGKVSATVGNYGRRETEGFVTGPLGVAETDFRLSYQVKHLDGYVDNVLGGTAGAPDRLDDLDTWAVRAQTLTRLPSGGTFGLIASYSDEDDAGAALAVKPFGDLKYPAELIFGAVPLSSPRKVEANVGFLRAHVFNINADFEQPIGENTLTVTANYRRSVQRFLNDCDGTRVDDCHLGRDNISDDYFLDAHLAGPGDARLRWLVGAVYQRFDIDSINVLGSSFPLSYLVPEAPSNIPVRFDTTVGGTIKSESVAVYADLRWKLNDIWSVTGQVRYSETEKNALQTSIVPLTGLNVVDFPASVKNDFVPFKVGLEGQLTQNILVYASFAKAFKDGAINLGALQTSPVGPEEVSSIETGIKSAFLNRRLQINAAVFHSVYDDLQLAQLVGTVSTLVNVPRAQISGAEVEVLAVPVEGLRLRANLGLLDPTLKEFSNGRNVPGLLPGPVVDVAGNMLPYTAKVSFNLGGDYEFEPVSGYRVSLGAEYAYHSRIYFSEFNDDADSQPGVGIFNATASLSPTSVSWRLFAYANNLSNETVKNGVTIYSGITGSERAVSYAPPRNFGLGLSVSF